jgi:hypothetical protein
MSLDSSTTRTYELASLPLSLAIHQNSNVGKAWLLTKNPIKIPLCVACQIGTAHRCPWCTKWKKSGSIQKPDQTKPGDGVSVDQIISAQPGLIPQMAGFLTSTRIWGFTTFVDHVSNYIYIHLMKDFTTNETLLAKLAFEKLCAKADCSVNSLTAIDGHDRQYFNELRARVVSPRIFVRSQSMISR